MYQKDLYSSMLDPNGTEFADTLKVLQTHGFQTWIALSTLSLLDNSEDQDKSMLPFVDQNGLENRHSQISNFSFQPLTFRMRNSGNIGASAPVDVSKFSKGGESFMTNVISGASSASTVIGVRPTFVDLSFETRPAGYEDYSAAMEE